MIDSRAVIDPGAQIDSDVTIGPYSVVGADVQIGMGSWLGSHVVITGRTRLGKQNKCFPFSVIGGDPQDTKYKDEDTDLVIGDNNVLREYCTISRGTSQGGGITRLGSNNWIMAYVHIAHDCQIGDHTTFSNNTTLAGHVNVASFVNLGGFTLVHQFCQIGEYAFSGMGSAISKDVPPYITVNGSPARARSLNTEGLKRHGFDAKAIQGLRKAYKTLYRSGLTLEESMRALREQLSECKEVERLVMFLEKQSRGIIR